MEEKTEGLLLAAMPHLGSQKILKVFTPEEGLISLISKKPLFALTDPFCTAEWVYRKGKSDLSLLLDGTLLNDFASLRHHFATLAAAGQIAQDLLRTQLPSKKGSGLYALALAYFGKLPAFTDPTPLTASFRIKLLLYEGLLALQLECAECGAPASCLSAGESFCPTHARWHTPFTPDEWEALHTLAYARRFAPLEALRLTPQFLDKMDQLFDERLGG